jgi:peptide/nickel transport system permease protein
MQHVEIADDVPEAHEPGEVTSTPAVPPSSPSSQATADAPPAPRKRRWYRNRLAPGVAAMYLIVLTSLAAFAPLLPLPDYEVSQGAIAARPFGNWILGTDQLGRDELSRVLWGARVSILIAVVSTVSALAIGMALGMVAGYFRGKIDTIITGVLDILLAFPTLVLLMAIIAVRGPTTDTLIFGVTLILTPGFARLARAATISNSQREFVGAARGLGATHLRVLTFELAPNVLPSLSAYAFSAAAHVFLVEGALSFLGLGVPPPTPAWGSMIQAGRPWFSTAPHIVLVPACTMALTIVAFNVLGDHFRHGGATSEAVPL